MPGSELNGARTQHVGRIQINQATRKSLSEKVERALADAARQRSAALDEKRRIEALSAERERCEQAAVIEAGLFPHASFSTSRSASLDLHSVVLPYEEPRIFVRPA